MSRTVIAIGSSTDRDYAFLAPLTALMWRRIGCQPLVLLVGTLDEWRSSPRLRVVSSALADQAISHRYFGRADGYPDATCAQNIRQHAAGSSSIPAEDWVMPADADLWPLRADYYRAHGAGQATLYYANGDHFVSKADVLARSDQGLRSQTLPTCHVAMRAETWREIYALSDDLAGSMKRTLDAWFATRDKADGMNLWMSDQQIMTEALCQQRWFPSGGLPEVTGNQPVMYLSGLVAFVLRRGHPPVDRLDRSHPNDWATFDPARWVDAHLHKAPESDAHWPGALRILEALLPEQITWAKSYRAAFIEAEK